MRVLFTTPAGLGHIHPSVPLAQAMVARGHDVQHVAKAGLNSLRRWAFAAQDLAQAGAAIDSAIIGVVDRIDLLKSP